jgi:shikimate dehydrogenase
MSRHLTNLMQADAYTVVGNPIAHSRSPWIHTQFAKQTGQQLAYNYLEAPLDGFDTALRDWVQNTGGKGCSVTMPFKQEAWHLTQHRSARAELAQAANTLRFDATGTWFADNTDGIGLVRDIEHNAQRPLKGLQVLLIGAGGAAAGALGALIQAEPAQIVVMNRRLHKAQALLERHQALAVSHAVGLQGQELIGNKVKSQDEFAFDVVINATSSSIGGQPLQLAPGLLKPQALVFDMMYGPAAEAFLAAARAQGAATRDGLGMLVEQAAEAFALWRGVYPQTAPVLAGLREQMLQQLPPT